MAEESRKARLLSRWSRPRRYACEHERCGHEAVRLSSGHSDDALMAGAHNCCGGHGEIRIPVVMTVDPW